MTFSVTITDRGQTSTRTLNFAISDLTAGGTMAASDIPFSAYNTIPVGTLEQAIQVLADQSFRTGSTPTGSNVAEGDTWYDTTNNQQYVYRETSSGVFKWVPIIFADSDSDTLDAGTF